MKQISKLGYKHKTQSVNTLSALEKEESCATNSEIENSPTFLKTAKKKKKPKEN